MKNAQKLVLKISVALMLLSGILGCNGCRPVEPDNLITGDDVKEIIIPTDQAKELYDTYSDRRVELIRDFENALDSVGREGNSNNQNQKGQSRKNRIEKATNPQKSAQQNEEGFQVVRYSFYDFESLKKYIAFIEQEADKANVDISSLRFYFANYPDRGKFENGNPVKEPRRNTLVLVPTVNTGNEEFAFFTADDSGDGERKAFLLSEELAETGKSFGGKIKNEASFLSNTMSNPVDAFLPPENRQSLAGNEFGLRPPK